MSQIGIGQKGVYEPSRPADARPIVVPQSRCKPRAIDGDQIRQATLPMLTLAPDTRLLRASLDKHIPPVIARCHLRHVAENDVSTARVEIAKPPGLRRRVLAK
jgi:hypothetical protein